MSIIAEPYLRAGCNPYLMRCDRDTPHIPCKQEKERRKKALFFTLSMLLSSLAGLATVPVVSATQAGDLAIQVGVNPIPYSNYSQWDAFYPQVTVQNLATATSSSRTILWETCAGDHAATNCAGQQKKTGTSTTPQILSNQAKIITFDSFFEYYNSPGQYTMIFRFSLEDQNPNNDHLSYTFTLVDEFKDVSLDKVLDIRPADKTYAKYDGDWVYNTNKSYPFFIEGVVTSCVGCQFEVNIGWELLDNTSTIIANDSRLATNPGGEWGPQAFNLSMPDLFSPLPGEYTLRYGVISSDDDMNDFNDISSTTVVFDNTMDLAIEQMYPSYLPSSVSYFYGEEAIEVVISNSGNVTVANITLKMEIFNVFDEFESGPYNCENITIAPGGRHTCKYDLFVLGSKKIKVSLPTEVDFILDAKPSNNSLIEVIDITSGAINPTAYQGDAVSQYDTGDEIMLISSVASTAAKPLNYTWFLAGFITYGNTSVMTFNASEIGMGDHMFMVRVEDALGNIANAYTYLTIFNRTNLEAGDWASGEAVTRADAELDGGMSMPVSGISYNLPIEESALSILKLEVVNTENAGESPGMDWMEIDFNLSNMIPTTIDRNSLKLYRLPNIISTQWQPLEESALFSVFDDVNASLEANSDGIFLLVGILPEIEVSPGVIDVELLPGGFMEVHWNPQGELDNPYFGGWQLFRDTMPVETSLPFPMVSEVNSESLWNQIINNRLVANLTPHADVWQDPISVETGDCVSYLLFPIDRQGNLDFSRGAVSGLSNSSGVLDSYLTCGDRVAPDTIVENFRGEASFTNNSECWSWYLDWNRCYQVELSWTWPSFEADGARSFNLYRLEMKPTDVDLTLLAPIQDNISFNESEAATYMEYGWLSDGPMPYHTYYYILAPVDEVGNVLLTYSFGDNNIAKVYVEDQYWLHREYLIPEPPPPEEPPLGIEYLGEINDYLEDTPFQIAGMIFIIFLAINLIGLPLMQKKSKRFKWRLAKKRKNLPIDDLDDDFAEFFD